MKKLSKILYVDDEPINLLLFERICNKNYQVITAQTGSQALEILSSDHDIEVVVSDLRMLEMDGLEFLNRVKELYPQMVTFIMTAYKINDKITHALEQNSLSGFFQKPFAFTELDQTICKALNRRTEECADK
jgi:two-component system, response regulator, stage 0 sporulation protein F